MDIDAVRAGAILVCPVKLARRRACTWATCTRSRATARSPATPATCRARSRSRSRWSRGSAIDGPVLFPVAEDLPFLARPLSNEERMRASALGRRYGVERIEESLPISVIGTGPDLNTATDNGLARAAAAARSAGRRGPQPGDDRRRDRDRAPPGRGSGHVPGAHGPAGGVRPAPLRGRAVRRTLSRPSRCRA